MNINFYSSFNFDIRAISEPGNEIDIDAIKVCSFLSSSKHTIHFEVLHISFKLLIKICLQNDTKQLIKLRIFFFGFQNYAL